MEYVFGISTGVRTEQDDTLGVGSQYVFSFGILKLEKVKYFGNLRFPVFHFFCDMIWLELPKAFYLISCFSAYLMSSRILL